MEKHLFDLKENKPIRTRAFVSMLAASLALVGCGASESESTGKGNAGDISRSAQISKNLSSNWKIESIDYVGSTKEGVTDNVDNLFMVTYVDAQGHHLLCQMTETDDPRGSATSDCNWEAFNDQVAGRTTATTNR